MPASGADRAPPLRRDRTRPARHRTAGSSSTGPSPARRSTFAGTQRSDGATSSATITRRRSSGPPAQPSVGSRPASWNLCALLLMGAQCHQTLLAPQTPVTRPTVDARPHVIATPTGFLRAGNDTPMTQTTPRRPSEHSRAGIGGGDVERLDRALTGISYPAPKWELLAHAGRDPACQGRINRRAIDLLWTLPDDDYRDRAQVLSAAARTARGHPRRPRSEPNPGPTVPGKRDPRSTPPGCAAKTRADT
jgi:hypothetical protein